MPGYDGTGPTGQGSRTGGGFGYCPPSEQGNDTIYGVGRGGVPRGGGRGRLFGGGRRGFFGVRIPENYDPPKEESKIDKILGLVEKIVEHYKK